MTTGDSLGLWWGVSEATIGFGLALLRIISLIVWSFFLPLFPCSSRLLGSCVPDVLDLVPVPFRLRCVIVRVSTEPFSAPNIPHTHVRPIPCSKSWSRPPHFTSSDFHDAAMIAYMLLTLPWMIGTTMTTPDSKSRVGEADDITRNAGVRKWR